MGYNHLITYLTGLELIINPSTMCETNRKLYNNQLLGKTTFIESGLHIQSNIKTDHSHRGPILLQNSVERIGQVCMVSE